MAKKPLKKWDYELLYKLYLITGISEESLKRKIVRLCKDLNIKL